MSSLTPVKGTGINMDRDGTVTSLRQSEKQPGVYTGQLTRLDYELGAKYAEELHRWADEHFRRPSAPSSCTIR